MYVEDNFGCCSFSDLSVHRSRYPVTGGGLQTSPVITVANINLEEGGIQPGYRKQHLK